MSDQDKLIILVLFFVFLASFFILFKLDVQADVSFFQYLFFIAALTMAFTGFLGATGTFSTTGQTIGGGAAIFLIMVLAVVGLKPYFEVDNSLKELVLLMKSSPEEKLSTNQAVLRAIDKIEASITYTKKIAQFEQEITRCQAKQDKLNLTIRYWDPPQRRITDNDDLLSVMNSGTGQLESKEGKYELATKDLRNDFIYIEPRTDNLYFGPAMLLKYDYNTPEIQLFVRKK
jgi:hypothetical protein